MTNLKRVRELTKEVDRYFKATGREENGYIVVPKDDFFNAILDIDVIDRVVYHDYEVNFLNTRINQKFHQVYREIDDIIEISDLYSMTYIHLLEYFEGVDEIKINYIDYKKRKDDISSCVFIIDKEIKHKVLTDYGLEYDRENHTYRHGLGQPIYLDEVDEETGLLNAELYGMEDEGFDMISLDDCDDEEVLFEMDKRDITALNDFTDSLGLTKRQREVATALVANNGNRTHTANELGVNVRNVRQTTKRIQDRVLKNFGYSSMTQYRIANKPIRTYKRLLQNENITYDDLFQHIVKNIKNERDMDDDVWNVVYKMPLDVRKPFIRHLKGKEQLDSTAKELFVNTFNEIYFKEYYN